jgi:hypothetical protein
MLYNRCSWTSVVKLIQKSTTNWCLSYTELDDMCLCSEVYKPPCVLKGNVGWYHWWWEYNIKITVEKQGTTLWAGFKSLKSVGRLLRTQGFTSMSQVGVYWPAKYLELFKREIRYISLPYHKMTSLRSAVQNVCFVSCEWQRNATAVIKLHASRPRKNLTPPPHLASPPYHSDLS